jgi:hypothetical protein
MTTETYPSGRQITTEYDGARRVAGVKKQDGTYYTGAASSDTTNRIKYAAHGAVAEMKLGNGLWEHTLQWPLAAARDRSRFERFELERVGVGIHVWDDQQQWGTSRRRQSPLRDWAL